MNGREIFMHTYHLQLMGLSSYCYIAPSIPKLHQDIIALLKKLSISYEIVEGRLILSSGEVALTTHAPEQKSDILNCILQEWRNDGVNQYE